MMILRHWATRHANAMERGYRLFERVLFFGQPLAKRFARYLDRPLALAERMVKGPMFDCKMCGNCLLSDTGLACVTNCPKSLRNGPCGGVRENSMCEVKPDMRCVWVEAWEGSARLAGGRGGAILKLQPPMEHNIARTSAWLRLLTTEPVKPAKAEPLPPIMPPPSNRLEQVFRSGRFVVTAEMSPPDSPDPADVYRSVAAFEGAVDAVNVTDASGANCHISSLGVCALLAQKGVTPVMQIACRDRNRIAIQGDILSAAALGVVNLLCLTGDGVANGDHRGAVPVFDLDSISLLNTARGMRDQGHFMSGRRLVKRPQYFLGAVANPFVPPYDVRPQRLAKKIAAGAQFIQTQFCFDVPRLKEFMAQVRDRGLHEKCFILVGVGPLPSARTARWFRSRVPVVHIPDAVIERMDKATDQRREGVKICVEIIQQIRQIAGVAGVHLMAHREEELIMGALADAGIHKTVAPAAPAAPAA
jgi:5,10-methylenetetrahydrofolate reductase